MRKAKLYLWMALSVIFALLSIIGAMLAHAIIRFGDGVINIPYWQLLLILGVPTLVVFFAVKVFRYCLRQLPFASLK